MGSMVEEQIRQGKQNPGEIIGNVGRALTESFLASNKFSHHFADAGIDIKANGLPNANRVAVREGRYRVVPFGDHSQAVIKTLKDFLAENDQIDCIVELGSGFGRNLFQLFQAARAIPQHDLEFHACELTAAGREVAARLQSLVNDMRLEIHRFDYYEPDLSFLDRGKNVLFFTVHSIEQIPYLPRAVFDQMLAHSNHCFCLHFEPVGWQFDDKLLTQRERGDRPLARTAASLWRQVRRITEAGFPGISLEGGDIGGNHRISTNAAAWSARLGYNKNLVPLLRTLKAEQQITIERECVDTFGDNPFNPASIVAWAKKEVFSK